MEVLDLTMEWNLFDHQSYWDAAAEALEKYPDADGIFAADQRHSVICTLPLKQEKESRRISRWSLMMVWMSAGSVIRR
mgnify:FL=1